MKTTKVTWLKWLFLCATLAGAFPAHAYYDSGAQRWLNRDPIAEMGGKNLYAFVANAPLELIDAKGLLGSAAAIISCSQCPNMDFAECVCTLLAPDTDECIKKIGACLEFVGSKFNDPFAFCECSCKVFEEDGNTFKKCVDLCKKSKKVKNMFDKLKKQKKPKPGCPDPDDEYKNCPEISIPHPPPKK